MGYRVLSGSPIEKGEEMRLLHTGDLHLDSAFCSYGAKDAENQREAGRDLLRRIFECAKNESCDMMLIAGDLFDSKFVTPESAELFCSLVEKYDIPVVLSPGNHDFYFENSFYTKAQKRLGDRFTLFTSSEMQMFDFDELGVRVFGYAFTGISLLQSPLDSFDTVEENGYIKLLCAHADITSPVSRYAPLTLSQLQKADFDYVALGHVHNRANESFLDGRVHYCGFAQGRSFDELGEGGVWIVDVDKDSFNCERKILSTESFYMLENEMPKCDDEASLSRELCELIKSKAYPNGAHLRMILTGIVAQNLSLDASLVDGIVKETGISYLEIIDETLPLLDGEYLERDSTLRGELYRTLLPKLSSADPEERAIAIKALQIGLAAIDGKNIFGASN